MAFWILWAIGNEREITFSECRRAEGNFGRRRV